MLLLGILWLLKGHLNNINTLWAIAVVVTYVQQEILSKLDKLHAELKVKEKRFRDWT